MSSLIWYPSEGQINRTRLYQFMQKLGYSDYEDFFNKSKEDTAWLWAEAEQDLGIVWREKYSQVLNTLDGLPHANWFVNGKSNITESCLDQHVINGRGDFTAIIWESDDGRIEKITYSELLIKVEQFANGLKHVGLQKGDRVALYLPMVIENVIAMLAVMRMGAIFTPCFSGFGGEALATRINDCKAKLLITADGFMRRGKVIAMKQEADRAVASCSSIDKVVVVRRLGLECPWDEVKNLTWDELLQNNTCPIEPMDSSESMMIIYTSGTTGQPKGTVHTHVGFPIKSAFDAAYGMDLHKDEVLFWVTDMGWMMGPWMVYSSLIMGSTMVMLEGSPDYPNPGRVWEMVERHQVTHLGVSPTLIRVLMKHGDAYVDSYKFDKLRVLGSTGEPWNPGPYQWLYNKVGKGKTPIFNYSGGTEISGGILGNVLIKPIHPCGFNSPLPGMDVDVWDEKGESLHNEVGELVIRKPWVGMTQGFWNDSDRYEKTYWSRWPNTWVHGDWVTRDEETWFITGRSDDTIKIAGKRLGPAEMESVLVDHPMVLEAATIGVPDEYKGEAAVCFVTLKTDNKVGREIEVNEMESGPTLAEGLSKLDRGPEADEIVTKENFSRNPKRIVAKGKNFNMSKDFSNPISEPAGIFDGKGANYEDFLVSDISVAEDTSSSGNQEEKLVSESELIQFVSSRMGKALQPKRVHVVSELPKTRNGKIIRRIIKATYLGEDIGDLSSLENAASLHEIKKWAMEILPK